jgi:hypothetical protein
MSKLKRHRKAIAIVAASVLAIGALSTGGAVAADKIGAKDIRSNAVRSDHIKNGAVKKRDLSKAVQRQLNKTGQQGKTGAQGPRGEKGEKGEKGAKGDPATDVKGGFSGKIEGGSVIKNIGGKFAERKTQVGESMTLEPGTYLINGYAGFDRINNEKVASGPVLQLAIRSASGEEMGTAFTGEFPAGDVEQSTSVSRVITIDEKTDVKAYVFGYNADGSSEGSGNYVAGVSVTAVRVG